MPRKEIEGAEEKIILATIEVAGVGVRDAYSTKEIGEKAGLSEFTVFSRFKNKENLLHACNDFVFNAFYNLYTATLAQHKQDPEGFFNAMLTGMIGLPSYVRFAASYSLVFPREGDVAEYSAFSDLVETKFEDSNLLFPLANRADFTLLVNFALQEMLQDALFIISGELQDTPEIRASMAGLFFHGAQPLFHA
jgi:AcrR family transcriptional regulator